MELERNEESDLITVTYTAEPAAAVPQELEPSTSTAAMEETSETEDTIKTENEADQGRIDSMNEHLSPNVTVDPRTFTTDSVRLQREYGITMVNDTVRFYSSLFDSGHSLVLTDLGKEVLDSMKQSEQQQQASVSSVAPVVPNSPNSTVAIIQENPLEIAERAARDQDKIQEALQKLEAARILIEEYRKELREKQEQLAEAKSTIAEYKAQFRRLERK